VPRLLPVCSFIEPLLSDEEELLLVLFRSELEDGDDPDDPVAEELPVSAANAGTESASTRAEAARAAVILAIRISPVSLH
jgi:hypothetical protein